jgi:hypothetical protein
VSTLAGVVSIKKHYGPPGWGETPTIDRELVAFLLTLNAPICVDGDPTSDINSDSVASITVVQVVASNQHVEKLLKGRVGRRVRLSGTLDTATTGWAVTPVVLESVAIQ